MKTRDKRETKATLPVDVGGSVALAFINTLRSNSGVPLDALQTDKDVLAWMKKMKIRKPDLRSRLPEEELLRSAKNLRAAALAAVKQKKAGKRINLAALNHLLAGTVSHLQLRRRKDAVELYREYSADSAEQFLAPVTEAISDLLAHGNFDLVRQCEGSDCVLWFLDRSNGRPRRFCTEEGCGTRTRVAAYRAKQAQHQANAAGVPA